MATDPADFRRRRRRRATARTSKDRACVAKEAMGRRRAHRTARQLREHGDHVHAYPCPWCGRWHVGRAAWEDLSW